MLKEEKVVENGETLIKTSEDKWTTTFYLENSPKLHRTAGPAVLMKDGRRRLWYNNGMLHNDKGPAIEDDDQKSEEFWVNGQNYSRLRFYMEILDWDVSQILKLLEDRSHVTDKNLLDLKKFLERKTVAAAIVEQILDNFTATKHIK